MHDEKFTIAAEKPSRHLYIWLLAAFGTLMFAVCFWIACQWIVPGPAIVVSRETTFLTAPLRPDGTPDYERWLLEKYRAGVMPENNAGVLIYQAIWPGELEPADYRPVCAELGLKEIPKEADALQPLYGPSTFAALRTWLSNQGISSTDDDDVFYDIVASATGCSWMSDDIPPLADWIKANQKALDLIVAATHRPSCYLPSPTLLNDDHDMLIEMLLPGAQGIRQAARGLAARAMWHLGEGRLPEAWSDTLALNRLACIAAQGQTIVEKLVAVANRRMAQDATLAILSDRRLPLELARQIQADLAKLDCPLQMREALATIERISALDSVVHLKLYGVGGLAGKLEQNPGMFKLTTADWNVVLRELNRWYDQLAAAVTIANFSARQQAIARFESNLKASQIEIRRPKAMFAALLSRRARSELIGTIMANLMTPAVSAAGSADDRNTAMSQLLDVAVALAIYRAENGEYPASLTELIPTELPHLPADKFYGKPLVYQRVDNGYLLYCLGENGGDDGGSNHIQSVLAGVKLDEIEPDARPDHIDQIPAEADDYSIRLPRPTFQLPTPSPQQK